MGISDLLKQAQQLQERLGKLQEEAATRTVEASAGGGMVRVIINGRLEVIGLTIDPEALKTGDVALLQDLILAAVNQAIRNAQAQLAESMQGLTGGLKIPGLTS